MMTPTQIKDFRVLAVGYALMRELSHQVGPDEVQSLVAGYGGQEAMARVVGRAAISAVDATAEVERSK